MAGESGGKNFVVFSELKAQVSIKDVLAHYGLVQDMKERGDSLFGCCPIHKGTNPTQFKVNLSKNVYYCFGQCKAGGNILDFVANMEKVSIRESALLIADWFNIRSNGGGERAKPQGKSPETEPKKKKGNSPLKFSGLKSLETTHPFFIESGFSQELLKHFEAGYFSRKGLMKGRLAIPIHTPEGVLVAYAGRALTQEPSFKFPPRFRPELELYNIHRQKGTNQDRLYIVQDPLDVWRLRQAGVNNAVALLNDEPSPEQIEILKSIFPTDGKILLLNEEEKALSALKPLAQQFFARLILIMKPLWQHKPGEVEKLLI